MIIRDLSGMEDFFKAEQLQRDVWGADDTPDPDDTDLGSYAVGIVCTLPTHAVMSETYSFWTDEDGVSGT